MNKRFYLKRLTGRLAAAMVAAGLASSFATTAFAGANGTQTTDVKADVNAAIHSLYPTLIASNGDYISKASSAQIQAAVSSVTSTFSNSSSDYAAFAGINDYSAKVIEVIVGVKSTALTNIVTGALIGTGSNSGATHTAASFAALVAAAPSLTSAQIVGLATPVATALKTSLGTTVDSYTLGSDIAAGLTRTLSGADIQSVAKNITAVAGPTTASDLVSAISAVGGASGAKLADADMVATATTVAGYVNPLTLVNNKAQSAAIATAVANLLTDKSATGESNLAVTMVTKVGASQAANVAAAVAATLSNSSDKAKIAYNVDNIAVMGGVATTAATKIGVAKSVILTGTGSAVTVSGTVASLLGDADKATLANNIAQVVSTDAAAVGSVTGAIAAGASSDANKATVGKNAIQGALVITGTANSDVVSAFEVSVAQNVGTLVSGTSAGALATKLASAVSAATMKTTSGGHLLGSNLAVAIAQLQTDPTAIQSVATNISAVTGPSNVVDLVNALGSAGGHSGAALSDSNITGVATALAGYTNPVTLISNKTQSGAIATAAAGLLADKSVGNESVLATTMSNRVGAAQAVNVAAGVASALSTSEDRATLAYNVASLPNLGAAGAATTDGQIINIAKGMVFAYGDTALAVAGKITPLLTASTAEADKATLAKGITSLIYSSAPASTIGLVSGTIAARGVDDASKSAIAVSALKGTLATTGTLPDNVNATAVSIAQNVGTLVTSSSTAFLAKKLGGAFPVATLKTISGTYTVGSNIAVALSQLVPSDGATIQAIAKNITGIAGPTTSVDLATALAFTGGVSGAHLDDSILPGLAAAIASYTNPVTLASNKSNAGAIAKTVASAGSVGGGVTEKATIANQVAVAAGGAQAASIADQVAQLVTSGSDKGTIAQQVVSAQVAKAVAVTTSVIAQTNVDADKITIASDVTLVSGSANALSVAGYTASQVANESALSLAATIAGNYTSNVVTQASITGTVAAVHPAVGSTVATGVLANSLSFTGTYAKDTNGYTAKATAYSGIAAIYATKVSAYAVDIAASAAGATVADVDAGGVSTSGNGYTGMDYFAVAKAFGSAFAAANSLSGKIAYANAKDVATGLGNQAEQLITNSGAFSLTEVFAAIGAGLTRNIPFTGLTPQTAKISAVITALAGINPQAAPDLLARVLTALNVSPVNANATINSKTAIVSTLINAVLTVSGVNKTNIAAALNDLFPGANFTYNGTTIATTLTAKTMSTSVYSGYGNITGAETPVHNG